MFDHFCTFEENATARRFNEEKIWNSYPVDVKSTHTALVGASGEIDTGKCFLGEKIKIKKKGPRISRKPKWNALEGKRGQNPKPEACLSYVMCGRWPPFNISSRITSEGAEPPPPDLLCDARVTQPWVRNVFGRNGYEGNYIIHQAGD